MLRNSPEPIVIEKNALEDVRVSLSEYKGHLLLDVRTFADFSGADAERKATKKGISLKVERLPELIAALQSLQASYSETSAPSFFTGQGGGR